MTPATDVDRLVSNEQAAADALEGGRQRRAVRWWTAALVLLCVGTLFLEFTHIQQTLPYPLHVDEGFISGPASEVLVKGQLHPARFNYPSLPSYIAAGAMAVGFLRGATHAEIRSVDQIGSVGYPYYETPRVMQTARQAFALLSVICLAMTGLAAWLAFRKPLTILLAPLILLASPLFVRHSWTYLNVDIVGTSFVMLAVAACLLAVARPSLRRSALVPGMFVGLAAGSKYTMVLAALPVLLALGLYVPRARRLSACGVALAAMLVAFLAAVPYSVIDIPGFLNGLGYEAFHYASGHAGFAGEPGLQQFLYYLKHFLSEFGYPAALLAVLGVILLPRADWRRAAVVTIFPAGLLWLLSSQRVHFTRNALAIHPFIAMFASFGLVVLLEWVANAVTRWRWVPKRMNVPVVVGLLLVIAAVPFWRFADHLRDRTDSRNLARAWVVEHIPANWTIVVPTELGFDLRGPEMRGRPVKVLGLRRASDPEAVNALLGDVPSPAVIMVPRWGADRRSPGRKTADALNASARQWRVMKTFGTNDVLVNYTSSTAWGDPAFAIAILR